MSDFRSNIVFLKPCYSAPSYRPHTATSFLPPAAYTFPFHIFVIVYICIISGFIIFECIPFKDTRLRALWATASVTQETLQKIFVESNLMEP